MSESATTSGFTVGVNDDARGFWRPGNETTSTWCVSTATALTRTAIWYTANPARAAQNIYIAPNGAFDALAVLVIEVSGLGAWDTVTGINTNYAAAATTLNLALGAPSGNAFLLAAVAGDNTANGQAFAPASWTTLSTVSATNGVDHTSDSVLTSAWTTTSGSISVNGTATSATDLSGAVIGVLTAASSPIPANQNPTWPYMKLEAGFGAGFQVPQDQITWTDLSTRGWSWDETSGVQFQLGELQATNLELEADNFDNLLASDNPASYFYTAAGVTWAPQAAFYDTIVSGATPLAWWKLNDAAGSGTAADSSGNSHTGTATSVTFGNASAAVTGNTSASFSSGSTSHILSSYNPALTAVTVEAWVNLNGLSQSSTPRIMANSVPSSDNKGFQLALSGASNNTPQVWFGNTSTFATVTAGAALPASGWTYLAATWDGTTVTLYVNGVAQGTSALSGSMPAGTATGIGIGYNPVTPGNYANGLLAECAVYGAAATASQIAARYTAGPGVTGTPVRIRAAVGTIGGVTANRWYVISRNIQEWPQQINPERRRYIPGTATDIWSVMSASGPTPYRGEVAQDAPADWWAMDDQPLAGGVQPATLRNSAAGNTTAITIQAASGGVTAGDSYSTTGTDLTTVNAPGAPTIAASVAVYAVGQQAGWMYGDPQSSPQSYSTGNPVTANPGSAAWQQTGLLGSGGSNGWFLTANDGNFPALSGGMSLELWFNATFFGTAAGYTSAANARFDVAGQPYSQLTLATLATASAPVAILYLDISGHLILETFNGGSGTNHTIYSTSDLRSASWHQVVLTTNGSTWNVYLNGGLSASVSGSGAGMTSAWSWLVIGADLGSSGGSTLSAATHMGNVAYSHAQVYSKILTPWRITAHYAAAITGFGLLPAPQAVSLTTVLNRTPGIGYTPDGSLFNAGNKNGVSGAGYGSTGAAVVTYSFSALAVAQAGSFNSGPSARVTISGLGNGTGGIFQGNAVWVSFTGLYPQAGIYNAASANAETNSSTVCGSGDAYSSGFGAAASGSGVCETAAGTGAAFPASASALGDTVQQRLERILGYGGAAYPGRCIDPAALAVQAATDIGGQQVGQNLENIGLSDGGLMYVDSMGNLTYWQKSHLAAQYSSPAWTFGPAASGATVIPYDRKIRWTADPHRVWNSVAVTPFSPDGSSLAVVTPTSAASVNSSQGQYGAQPHPVTSYLQSTTEMQNQANWLFEYFGQIQIRVEDLAVDAASYPAAWSMVLGVSVGDVVSVQNWQIGGGGATGTFRVSEIHRRIKFGGQDEQVEGAVELTCDFEPNSYWA